MKDCCCDYADAAVVAAGVVAAVEVVPFLRLVALAGAAPPPLAASELPPLPPEVLQKSQSNPMFKTFASFDF